MTIKVLIRHSRSIPIDSVEIFHSIRGNLALKRARFNIFQIGVVKSDEVKVAGWKSRWSCRKNLELEAGWNMETLQVAKPSDRIRNPVKLVEMARRFAGVEDATMPRISQDSIWIFRLWWTQFYDTPSIIRIIIINGRGWFASRMSASISLHIEVVYIAVVQRCRIDWNEPG